MSYHNGRLDGRRDERWAHNGWTDFDPKTSSESMRERKFLLPSETLVKDIVASSHIGKAER